LTPGTSQVNGFEQKILTITFHPPIEKKITGWKQAQVVPEKQKPPKREKFPSQVPFAITGGFSPKFAEELRTELRFMGRPANSAHKSYFSPQLEKTRQLLQTAPCREIPLVLEISAFQAPLALVSNS